VVRPILFSAYGFAVLIWISFSWCILVSTCKDIPPNTYKLTYLVLTCRKTPINQSINQPKLYGFSSVSTSPESYRPRIPYFHIIRDVTARTIYLNVNLRGECWRQNVFNIYDANVERSFMICGLLLMRFILIGTEQTRTSLYAWTLTNLASSRR